MAIKYVQQGNNISVVTLNDKTTYDTLLPAIYSVKYSDDAGFYLTIMQDSFSVPSKLYGSIAAKVDKITTTYNSHSKHMGVLLTGNKGTGKTVLTEILCNRMLENNIPIVLINEPFLGTSFMEFIKDLGECVLLFDEFGKVYNNRDNPQEGLLTLLDGNYSARRLVLFTENSADSINDFLLNRPGRVHYHLNYERVEDEVILQYASDNNLSPDVTKDLVNVAKTISGFSFDMLSHLVSEHLLYGEAVKDTIQDLNIARKVTSTRVNVLELSNPKYPNLSLVNEPVLREGTIQDGRLAMGYYRAPEDKEIGNIDYIFVDEDHLVNQKGTKALYSRSGFRTIVEDQPEDLTELLKHF